MKCVRCGGEWVPPKNISVSVTNCPFCGMPILSVELAKSYTLFSEFLQYIISFHGPGIYKDKQLLNNLVSDLYLGKENLKRIYQRAILDDSLSVQVYELSKKPEDEKLDCFHQIVSQLANANFYTKEISTQIVQVFMKGLGEELALDPEEDNDSDTCEDNEQGIEDNYIEPDYKESVKWYKLAAEKGDADAQNNLGVCYYFGQGVEQNYKTAVKWYRMAAKQGHIDGSYNLGVCYEHGEGVKQNYKEAVKWYRLAAEKGDAYAQNNLGVCYDKGMGVKQDYKEAVKWYRLAAEKKQMNAQNNLGICYEYGQGVEQNYKEAAKWYRLAAEQGYMKAQNSLGACYEYGNGVVQSYKEAVKWYRLAAEQGDANALYNLGFCYKLGKGKKRNTTEAIEWHSRIMEREDEKTIRSKLVCKWKVEFCSN